MAEDNMNDKSKPTKPEAGVNRRVFGKLAAMFTAGGAIESQPILKAAAEQLENINDQAELNHYISFFKTTYENTYKNITESEWRMEDSEALQYMDREIGDTVNLLKEITPQHLHNKIDDFQKYFANLTAPLRQKNDQRDLEQHTNKRAPNSKKTKDSLTIQAEGYGLAADATFAKKEAKRAAQQSGGSEQERS